MNHARFTVPQFLLAFFAAVAAMPTNVYQVCAWNVGTVEAEPWRAKESPVAAAAKTAFAWLASLWRQRSFRLGVAVAMALLAAHVNADAAPMAILPVAGIVEQPTLAEVKAAIEASNRLFEEFKQTNDARLKQLEAKGIADPLLTEKIEKMNKAMDTVSELNEKFMATQATVNRLKTMGFQGDPNVVEEKALAKFNAELKATAMASGRAYQPIDAAGVKAYNEAFEKFLRRGNDGLTDIEKRALSVGTDSSGGYLVSPDTTGKAVVRMFETSPMRQYASVQVISTDALEGTVDLEEASFGWVSELGTRSESNTPAGPQPWRIPVHEAYSEPRISQKLAEDASGDPVGWLAKKVGDKFGRGYNTAFVTGTGIGKPRGFASYTTAATADASRSWGVFEHNATGSNGAFGADPGAITDLVELIHAMKDHFLTNAAWYMNRTTLGYLRTKTDASSAGKYIFIPSFQAGMPDQVMGYPVRKLQDMATYSTTDALAIAFGDMLECYQIVDRLGLTALVDPYTAKPYIKYYTRGRVGGDVLNFEAMKFIKFGS